MADLLRKQIQGNQLPPNTQLPSERELCEQHAISRITVRKAMDELLHEGLVYTCVGKGTYVAEPKLSEELQPFSSFTEDMQRRGMAGQPTWADVSQIRQSLDKGGERTDG